MLTGTGAVAAGSRSDGARAPAHAAQNDPSAGRLELWRPWRDALIVILITLAAAALSVQFNVSERLHRFTLPWERVQLDELPDVLWVLTIGLAWYAVRRYRDARRDVERRRAAEARLGEVLADNRRLSQQYVDLQESERKVLARELHDELGQYLNVIKLDAVGIRDARDAGEAAAREGARAIVETCNRLHGVVAAIIGQLRPVGLDELGLAAAVEHCVATWRPRLPGADLRLSVQGECTDLPEDVALTAYRLVQEALTNVARHAAAGRVTIELDRRRSDRSSPEGSCSRRSRAEEETRAPPPQDVLHVTVADDGVGLRQSASTRGLGLIGMRERVAALHGTLEVASSSAGGFQLSAWLPVRSP